MIAKNNLIIQKVDRSSNPTNTSALGIAIDTNNIDFLRESLYNLETSELKALTRKQKRSFCGILVDFLDGPLRLEAMDCIYTIVNEVGEVEGLCEKLIGRSSDFSKLIYLKGKIDYLKYRKNLVARKVEVEHEASE